MPNCLSGQLYNNINDPMMSTQAKILFGLNIFSSMMTVVVSLVTLFMKQMLLKQQKRQDFSMEFDNIYDINDTTSMHDNPLHERNDDDDVRAEIIELKEENAGLKEKIRNWRRKLMVWRVEMLNWRMKFLV